MKTIRLSSLITGAMMLASTCAIASGGPWYTGPLLAPAGHTIPAGHTNFETYAFYTNMLGAYSLVGSITPTPENRNTIISPIFSHGLSDKVDIQFSIPYSFNRNEEQRANGLGDAALTLGYQLIEQGKSIWRPDLRLSVQEIVPTGRYDRLNPLYNGTDATGLGSFQTGINLNFQHLYQFDELRYLRTRFSVGYAFAQSVIIHGYSVYGGNRTTIGKVDLGNQTTYDLAGELSLTQHWVAVMEAFTAKRIGSDFRGVTGFATIDQPNVIGSNLSKELTLAPAIEYNFTPNIGLIGGTWFTLRGRSTPEFISGVIALNLYW